MKHSRFRKPMAFLLALMLCVTMVSPAFAARITLPGSSSSSSYSWSDLWNKIFGKGDDNTTDTDTSEDINDPELTLIEDETTVAEGTKLRASTYAVSTASADDGINALADGDTNEDSTTLKYFPVTMYNYDATTINNATHQVEVDSGETLTQWNGIYFNDGEPDAESYDGVFIKEGTYIIQNARAAANNVGSWLVGDTSGITSTTNQSDATRWTVQSNGDGTYTLNSTSGFMTIGEGENGEKTATTASNIEIVGYTGNTYAGCVQLKSDRYYLCQWGGKDKTVYGGYNKNNDAGNAFYLYKVTDSSTEQVTFTTTVSLPYAAWNWWNKNTGNNDNGQKMYTGLVEPTLTANKDIKFTKPDGGIFNSDATVKQIYTGVEMPFVYKNGTYTFDASQNAVYFHEDEKQRSTAAQSHGRLYFDEGKQQAWNSISFGDGSKTVWAPFDDTSTTNLTGSRENGKMDYHFGMRTTIPFTMTANGRLNPNDDTSTPITFSFSGDDDVWVFIDGQLVIDLGGIHNRLDATIDFAADTITYSESNTSTVAVGSYNDSSFQTKQTLFGGAINQTRETFAASDSHELTIFYLERGAGSSNCKIQFNLPMKDTVSVTKRATQSISSDGTLSPLTAKEQETVNNIDFGFTLTKNGTPVANTNYSLLNANGQVISTPSTDANGHFTLRNGQTAKFVGEIAADGAVYKVVEDDPNNGETETTKKSFTKTEYTYGGESAGGYTVNATSYAKSADIPSPTVGLESEAVTAKGSTEAEDSLKFICENYMNANLPNPSSRPVDDKIVIDYGLPVIIDALANDVYRGDTIELTDVTGAQYGTATIENGKITYTLNKQLTGVEVLTYTARVTGTTTNAGGTVQTADESNTAKVYIIPATTMYYEENFTGLVTYYRNTKITEPDRKDEWNLVGTVHTDPQEPGVVGTVGDSPYGSDAAYLNDSGDSNGTSKYVSTAKGAQQFSYTFTGTGTSFFAHVDENAAYMRVKLEAQGDTSKNYDKTIYRDNIYRPNDDTTKVGTLYNIPVFTEEGLPYGNYKVTVTLYKSTLANGFGSDFYLDGIRVVKPLDTTDANASVANAAYATDGEANMTVETLRNKLLADYKPDGSDDWVTPVEGDPFVLFTDSNGEMVSASEYESNGPKEEVYLNNGQSVTFSLKNWDTNSNKIYLGIKAPLGNGTVSINNNTMNLGNAADCYYDISGYAEITEGTDENGKAIKIATFKITSTNSLISVTNIKVTGNAEFVIAPGPDIDGDSSET